VQEGRNIITLYQLRQRQRQRQRASGSLVIIAACFVLGTALFAMVLLGMIHEAAVIVQAPVPAQQMQSQFCVMRSC